MTDSNSLAAELLEASAAGFASAASTALQATPDLGAGFSLASLEWKAHLKQRLLELATAVRLNRPDLFARRIQWLRKAVAARGGDEREMRAALESLRLALDQELPEQLKSAVTPPIELALSAFESDIETESHSLDAATPSGKLGLRYLEACLEARTDDAVRLILNALDDGLTPQAMHTEVLLPTQREIGQLWHLGEVSVSEERLVSETTREVMTLIVNRLAPIADSNRVVIAASVAGNAHDIGLRAVANLFRLAGWRVIFLGADMPIAEIAPAAQYFDARLVVLSATLTTQIGALAESIGLIKQVESAPPVLVGGLALEDSNDLWRELGADAYAPDAASAVAIGTKLIARG